MDISSPVSHVQVLNGAIGARYLHMSIDDHRPRVHLLSIPVDGGVSLWNNRERQDGTQRPADGKSHVAEGLQNYITVTDTTCRVIIQLRAGMTSQSFGLELQ